MRTYQYICCWVRVNEDGTQKKSKNVRPELKKSTMFGMRQLKGLKLSQKSSSIVLTFSLQSLTLKKVKQNKVDISCVNIGVSCEHEHMFFQKS